MTTGESEETGTCGRQERVRGNTEPCRSVTALSTIAIQAGRSQLVVSVLRSGSLVHLQLVQVHPGLCEIGSNQEENQTMIQDQLQLMDKLKQHEKEALAVVKKGRQTEQERKWREEEVMELKRSQKIQEEDRVSEAMVTSLSEGWSLLLRLLERRQEVLMLASDFYRQTVEFSLSIDRVEALQIRPDDDKLTDVQLTYDSMRRDLLGKSLQVLASSSALLQKLKQLQRTEALQRRGGVLQDQEEEEGDEESSQCSRGVVLRLEELVESLQDRRRRADQAVRLQLGFINYPDSARPAGPEGWSLSVDKIQSEPISADHMDPQSCSRTGSRSEDARNSESSSLSHLKHESTTELKPRFKLDVKPESQSEETRDMEPAFRSEETRNLKSPSSSDLMPQSRSEVQPGSKLRTKPRLILEEIKNQSGFRLKLKAGSRSDLKENCKSEEIQDHQPESRLKETRDLQVPGSRSVQTTDVESVFRSQEPRNSEEGSRPDSKSESRSGETEERQPGSISDIKHKSTSDLKSGSNSEKTRSVKHGSRSDLQSETMLEKIRNFDSGSRTEMKPRTILDLKTESRSETKLLLLDEQPRSRLENTVNSQSKSTVVESKDLQTGSTSNVQLESGSNLKPESRSEEIRDPQSSKISVLRLRSRSEQTTDAEPGFRSEEHRNLESESRSDPQPGSRLREITQDLQSEFKSVKTMPLQLVSPSGLESESKSEMKPRSVLNLKTESRSETKQLQLDVQPRSGSEKTVDLQSESTAVKSKDLQRGSRSNVQLGSNLKTKSRSEEAKNLQPGFKLNQMPGLRSEELRNLESGSRSDIKSDSRSDLSPDGGETSNSQPGSRSSETRNLQPGSQSEADDVSLSEVNRKQEETRQLRPAMTSSGQVEVESTLGKESQSGGDQAVLTNQEQQLLSSCEHLLGKVWCWVQQGSSVLSNSSDAGRQLSEAQHTLNTHLKLHTQAEAIGHDAETLKQILDQIQVLRTDSTIVGSQPPSDPTRRLSPLKALTQQLKTGRHNRPNTTQDSPPAADSAGTSSSELATQVDVVLKALQSLNRKIDINLQLLKPHVTFFQAAQQVEEEMEELREVYRKRPQEKEAGTGDIKKCVDTRWQEMMQRLAATQELGKKHIQAVTMVSGSGLDVQSVVSVVQQMIENLNRTRQEINELQIYQQIQVQQQKEDMTFYRKYQEKLLKTLQDLNCVSELLDSCTVTDLGSDLQTSRLMEHFSQARPHFSQLDSEVEYVMKSWETMRGVQERLEVKEVKGESVKEKDLSELLKLQKTVKEKIQHSELILDLTNSFHLTAKQLEALLHSDTVSSSTGSSGVCGSREDQQQIQNLFKTASVLKTDICTAVTHSGWTSFRLEQLEVRLQSLDSLCVSWLNEMARREEKLHREQLTRQLNDDISQLRDSFKELKKRFSNLKFNYLKRNDRTRNMKAVRNQLQQVELYEEKLQVLKKKLQGVTTRLGSEVKDGGVAREVEDAINELQRQMGEFERSVCEHKKTLDMTCRLQQAMEEYQFWCEEASATIARVGKFSSECRSTEAVAVLYRQFEKFVWPTVPQQEERISQITELAVRLHGAEEGRRYIEKTVSKHSEMVESIRELSDGLMKLEAKLKLENLKLQEKDREKETKGEEEMECKRENEKEEKDEEKENKLKENRNLRKKEQRDNRSTQEAADMYELKETGHTPELTTEHDGRKVPVKRQTAANRKPPLQKSRSQEAESRQQSHSERFTSSFCSTHTLSLPCSPVEATRRVRAIHSQSQPDSTDIQATPPPSMIDMSLSDVQGEMQETGQQDALAGGLSETELQQQETMTEGSLSNDEYDCVSPDDISLPPMAETPESFMVQSDIEEGLCFSSHSAHISQYNQHYRAQSEHSGSGTAAGAVRQQRESSRAEGCPSPPTSLHNSTRFRSESSSFIQGPLPAPAATVLTSTVCSILRTEKISKDNKDCEVPEQRSPSKTELHCGHYNQPQRSTGNQGKSDSNVTSKSDTEPTPHLAELSQSPGDPKSSCSPQPCNDPDTELHKDYTPPQNTQSFSKCATISAPTRSITCKNSSFTQSFPDSETVFDQDIDSSQTRKEKTLVCKPQKDHFTSTNTVTQQTIYVQSSLSDTYCTLPQDRNSLSATHESLVSQCKNSPQAILIHQAGGFAQSPSICKDNSLPQDSGLLKCSGPCLQTSTTLTQIKDLPQSHPDSRGVLDLKVPSSQTSKETSSVNMPQSHTTAPTVIQQTVSCPPPPSDSHCNTPQASSTLRSKQESSFSQCRGNIPNVHASNRFSSKQCHQTVYSHHECLTSTCAQQCVHDHGMTPSSPAKPAAPPQPETQTQALAPQVNPHVRLPSSPPHLLTSDQDPDICQPMFIREEIRLTPQIQGPPLPGPPQSQAQAESLPQGKASKPGPPFFTRPLSRATVMEGSPVTLEVEVTGHHEPTLTWFKDGDVSAISLCRALVCEDRKHFLFNPEASDSDGGACEARAAVCHDSQRMAGNISDGGDRWLVAEVLDIMGVDWLTWFGTLCALLWLLYLIIL